jgi:hypothetical protein
MKARVFLLTILAISASAATPVRGDVFELKDGGQVVGDVVERTSGGDYVIRSAGGVETKIAQAQVQRLVPQTAAAAEHERRSRTAPDTVDAHRELAEWCRQHELAEEAELHLERVIELDPSDEEARLALGYQRVGDRWLTRDQLMTARGLVFHEGRWRTPQDVAVRQRDSAEGNVEAEWHSKLRLWRGWLDGNRAERVEEARQLISAIDDPRAAPALVKLLDDEDDEWKFDLVLATLGRLNDPLVAQTLVAYSLEDDDPEIRARCVDYLTGGERPVSLFPYIQALRSKENYLVNRAGEALGAIGDPAAISPLIDALVTRHKYEVQPGGPGGGPGGISAGFDPGGGSGGFSFGGNGPKIIQKDEENLGVLRALTKLSGGQNFDYDERAWRHWFVDQQMRQQANARRDQ